MVRPLANAPSTREEACCDDFEMTQSRFSKSLVAFFFDPTVNGSCCQPITDDEGSVATSTGSREVEPMIFKMQEEVNDESLSTDGEIDDIITANEEESLDIRGGWNWKRNSAECSDNIFLPLSIATWAELQRCRHLSQEPDSLLNALQAESGCQIHVDRYFQAIKVVGPSSNFNLLRHLLQNLEQVCSEKVVPLATLDCSKLKQLSDFALKWEVTVHVTTDQLQILGLRENVDVAVIAIQANDTDSETLSTVTVSFDEVDAETCSEVSVILKLPQLLHGSSFRRSCTASAAEKQPTSVILQRCPPGLVIGRAPVKDKTSRVDEVCYICFKNPPFPQPYFKWPKNNICADSLMLHFC